MFDCADHVGTMSYELYLVSAVQIKPKPLVTTEGKYQL